MTPPFLWRFVCADFKEYPSLISQLRQLPMEILNKRRQNKDVTSRDLISRLIEARENGEFTSDEEVIDELLLFFVKIHQ